jgi:hypothetical protein
MAFKEGVLAPFGDNSRWSVQEILVDEMIKNLAPLFVAGLAVQQLVELPDSLLSLSARYQKHKKAITKIVALGFGLFLAHSGQFHVLSIFNSKIDPTLDMIVAGFIVSGGTESINSVIKFLGYAKENKKAVAATATAAAGTVSLAHMSAK